MSSLVITLDHKGEPSKVELDGKTLFVTAIDIKYRPCEPGKITLEAYVQDLGTVIARHPGGEPKMEQMEFYAVSKEDHELLLQLKKKDTL